MADDVNANIRIDLDTSEAVVALRNLQAQISAFNQSVIKSNASAVAAQQGMLSTLTAQIGATRQFSTSMVNVETSVSKLGRAIDKNKLTLGEYFRYGVASSKNFGRVFGREHTAIMELAADRVQRLQTQYIALGEAQNGMTRAMAVRPLQLYNADAAIGIQRQQLFNKLLNDGSTSLVNFGKNTQWAGRQLMVGFTVPLTIFGGMAGKIFMDLERQIINFRRVYGDATTPLEETNGMIVQVQELAKEFTKYGIAVRDTVGLASDAAAAGAQGDDLIAATAQATRLSTLGMIDQQQALTATIALQSAFKLNTEELANAVNFLNAVENQTVVSLADITEAIPKVAPIIQGLGGDVQDLAVFMAALREGGVSAGEGANALKSGLASLINPTKNAREQLEKVGINIDAILQTNKGDIQGTVRAFGDALMQLGKFERQQTLATVFGKFQFARMGALFENISRDASQAQRVVDLTGMSIQELGSLAEKELSAIEESVGTKFTGAMERLKLAIAPVGEAFLRIATPIIEFATKMFEKFNELSPSVKDFILVLTAGLGVVAPTVIMLIGLFANFAGNAVKGLALMNNFFNRLRGGAGTLDYLSDQQLDAAAAAASLEGKTESLTSALNVQRGAVGQLAKAYGGYSAAARAAAGNLPQGFRGPLRGMAAGGIVGGTGNKDSEPALLTPGEFVMNKEATQRFGPVLDAMNRGNIKQLQEGSRLTQRTHLTAAVPITASEALMERITNSTKSMLSVIQKVEGVLGRSISNISKVSNLIVEMPTQFNQAMKSGIGQAEFATQFGAVGTEKYRTTAAITKQDFETLKPHLEILDREIVNASKDFAVIGDMNIDQITKKAFEKLPEESRRMLAEVEGLSTQFNNLRVSVQDLDRLTDAEKQRLAAAGISFRTGSDPNRQYITVPGMGTASTRTRQETRSAGPSYRRSPLFSAGVGMGEAIDDGARSALQASSPSKKGKKVVEDYGDGMLSGARQGKIDAGNAGAQLGQSFALNLDNELSRQYGAQFPAGRQSGAGRMAIPRQEDAGRIHDIDQAYAMAMAENTKTTNQLTKEKRNLRSRISGMSGKFVGAGLALDGIVFAASMMNNSVGQFAQKIMPIVFSLSALQMVLPTLARLVPLLSNPIGAMVAIVGAAVGGFLLVKKVSDDLARRGRELSDAMIGTADSLDNMAKFFDKQTYAQQLAQTRVQAATGTQVTAQETQEAQGFVSSDLGKLLLEDIRKVRELAGDENATEALQNRLQSMMLSGLIGPKLAYAIATEIGTQLGDTQISVDASAKIKEVIGYNGENLEDNDGRMKILADIIANTTSLEDTFKNAGLIWDGTNWFMQAVMVITGKGTSDIAAANIAGNILNAQTLIGEQLAKNRLEFERGEKNAEEFYQTNLDILDAGKQAGATYETAMEALKKAYSGTNLIHEINTVNQQIFNGFAATMDTALGKGWRDFVSRSSKELQSSLITVIQDSEGDLEYSFDGLKIDLLNPADIQGGISYYEGQMEMVESKIAEARKNRNQEDIDLYTEMLDQLDQSRLTLLAIQEGGAKLQIAIESNILGPEALNNLLARGDLSYSELSLKLSMAPDASAQLFYQLLEESGGKGFRADFAINILGWDQQQIDAIGADLFEIMNLPPVLSNPVLIEWSGMTPEQISQQLATMNVRLKDFEAIDTVKEVKIFWNDQAWSKNFANFVVDWQYIAGLTPLQKSIYMNYIQNIVPPTDPQERRLWEKWIAGGGIPGLGVSEPAGTIPEETLAPVPEDTGGASEKTKSWLEQLLADTKANLKLFVGNLDKGVNPIINRLRKLSIPDQIIDAIGTGEEGLKRAQEILGMTKAQRRAFIDQQNRVTVGEFLRGPGGLNEQVQQQQNRDKAQQKILKNREINKDILDKILNDEKAVNAILAARGPELDKILNRYEELQTVEDVTKSKVKEVRDQHEETEKILNQQIETQQEIVNSIQDQIDAIEKKNEEDQWAIRGKEREKELIDRQIEALDRANEMDQRRIDTLQRQDELRNREADALSRELDELSRIEEQTRESYQQRIDALDKVAEINRFITNQQRQQLGLSQALSQGDIYAATAAVQEIRQSQAEFSQQQMRAGLEQGMENAVAGLRTSGGLTREQAEERIRQIREQSYQTSLLIRDIEDRIFQRNQEMIPLKDQQYNLDLQIRDLNDQIFNRETEIHKIRKDQLTPQQQILSNLNKEKEEMQKITDEAINQIEALADQGTGVNEVTKRVDELARAWTVVQRRIALANKTAREKLEDLGDFPDRQAGETSTAYKARVAAWQKRREEINAERGRETSSALADGNAAMEANAAKMFAGGMVNYKGSTEPPPAQMMRGGKVKKYPMGGLIPYADGGKVLGKGAMDSVNALLTPGEFVIRRAMVDKYGIPMMNAINQGAFGMPKYSINEPSTGNVSAKTQNNTNPVSPMYNNYSVNVSVSNTNASADEIANKTIMRIKQMQDMQIRSGRGY